jgi:chromosome partitioning protein
VHVVSVINYKGGVGKTTLTANLGGALASLGHRVLLLDFDPQTSLTLSFYSIAEWDRMLKDRYTIRHWFDAYDRMISPSLADYVTTPDRAKSALDGRGQLDVVASHFDLIGVDLRLSALLAKDGWAKPFLNRQIELHSRLANALNGPSLADYDYVLIDCPPNFNLATQIAMIASTHVVYPARADYLSMIGLRYLNEAYRRLVASHNDGVRHLNGTAFIRPALLGIVFTMVQYSRDLPDASQHNYMLQARQSFPVFESSIRYHNGLFGNAGESGVPVALREGVNEDVAADIRAVTEEFVRRIDNNEGMSV